MDNNQEFSSIPTSFEATMNVDPIKEESVEDQQLQIESEIATTARTKGFKHLKEHADNLLKTIEVVQEQMEETNLDMYGAKQMAYQKSKQILNQVFLYAESCLNKDNESET